MLKVEKFEVFNFEGAIRGARNPMNSWAKSDSYYDPRALRYVVGENDLALMKRLVSAGSDERKFMRQILVSMDITAPLYWWKECDTYKVGTVANSCSTMHRIHTNNLKMEDFSCENMTEPALQLLDAIRDFMNHSRRMFLASNDKKYWHDLIKIMPTSYNQKRTLTLNYEVLRNIYHARRHHKLDEWHTLCDEIEKMPYSELITMSAKVAK